MTGRGPFRLTTRVMRVVLAFGLGVLLIAYWNLRQPTESIQPDDTVEQVSIEVPEPPDPTPVPEIIAPPPMVDLSETGAYGPVLPSSVGEGLDRAARLEAEGALVQPEKDNALAILRGVLVLDPENTSAQQSLERIRQTLEEELASAVDEHAVDVARPLVSALETFDSSDVSTQLLLEQAKRQARASTLAEEAVAALSAGDVVSSAKSAAAQLQRAMALDPTSPTVRSAREAVLARIEAKMTQAMEAGLFGNADRWMAWLQRLEADAVRIDALADLLESSYQGALMQEQRAFVEALRYGQFEQAEAIVPRIAALRPKAFGVAQEAAYKQRIDHARVYGGYAPGDVFRDPVGQAFGPSMTVLPAGTFVMGALDFDDRAQASEKPSHPVRISKGFALSRHEIRVQDFAAFVAATGYMTDAERNGFSFIYNESSGQTLRRRNITWRDDYTGREADPNLPVVHVSWNDAQAYVRWLTEQTGWAYHLPTEAQFEYALRSGSQTTYPWGEDGPPDAPLENLTGERDASPRERRKWARSFSRYTDGFWGPAPVMSLLPNAFGLYDMAGNVAEWTWDCWHDSYVRAPDDARAWINRGCERRVARGSFWGGPPQTARSSYRIGYLLNQRGSAIGFRVARQLLPR